MIGVPTGRMRWGGRTQLFWFRFAVVCDVFLQILNLVGSCFDVCRYLSRHVSCLCTCFKPENLHQYQSTHSQCGFDWFSDNLFVADAKGSKITWKQKYETAVGHFIEANEDYRRVLALFPKLHAHLQPLAMALPPNIRTHANPQDIPIERPDFRETYKFVVQQACAFASCRQCLTRSPQTLIACCCWSINFLGMAAPSRLSCNFLLPTDEGSMTKPAR